MERDRHFKPDRALSGYAREARRHGRIRA
ncbi:DUF2958 domain-containing protein [Mesorhizobium kowhaii]